MSEEKKCCREKIVYLVLLVAIFLCSAVSAFYSYKTNSILASSHAKTVKTSITKDYAKNKTIEKAKESEKPTIVLFYADWCGYCVRFMPIYQALSEKYKDSFDFSKVNVEDRKYEKTVRTIGITGFPTVFIIDPKYDNKVLLSNTVLGTVEDISVEMDRYNRIRKLLDSKK